MDVFFLDSALEEPLRCVSPSAPFTSNVTCFSVTFAGLLDLTDFDVGFLSKLGLRLEKLLLGGL